MEAMNYPMTPPQMKADKELVQCAQAGEQWAYTQLVSRHQAGVRRLMGRLVHSESEVEDLTQEAFSKAFYKIQSYVPDYAFSTWLYRIATNNGIDYLRRQRLSFYSLEEVQQPTRGPQRIFSSSHLNAEQVLIRKQLYASLRSIVARLSPAYRKIIELRYFEELSYEEIAERCELPLGTVKAQLYRAKARMRTWLQAEG